MQNKNNVPQKKVMTSDLLPNDVLLGRGTGPNEHVGNCLFRDEVENHKEAYISAPNKATEQKIVSTIISSIHQNRGRFLRKSDSQQDLTGKPMYEVVVDRKLLAYKIKQAIRYSKRRDKKLEAFKEGKKIDESRRSSQLAASSQTSSQEFSRLPLGTGSNLLSSESQRLLRMAQSQLVHPAGRTYPAMVHNSLSNIEPPSSNTLSPDVLDQLAILHLQKTDPLAHQLVLDRRRQQEEAIRLGHLRQQQQLGMSSTTGQHQGLFQERSSLLEISSTVQPTISQSTVVDRIRSMTMINRAQSVAGQLGGSLAMDAPTSPNQITRGIPENDDSKGPVSKQFKSS